MFGFYISTVLNLRYGRPTPNRNIHSAISSWGLASTVLTAVTEMKMKKHGLLKGKDLREKSKEDLVRVFGDRGSYYYSVSRGIDHREVNP